MRHRQVEKIVLHRVARRRNAEAQRLAPLHPELIVQLRCEAAPATAITQLDRQQDQHADEALEELGEPDGDSRVVERPVYGARVAHHEEDAAVLEDQ